MEELKPCPFCGGKNVRIHKSELGVCWCTCFQCSSSGAVSKNEQEAAKAWNRRDEPPNPPLTLDELHQMVGEPVWIESPDMPNLHGWAINYGLDPDVMHIQYAEVSLDMYGKTWLAYRRRPEEEHNE